MKGYIQVEWDVTSLQPGVARQVETTVRESRMVHPKERP